MLPPDWHQLPVGRQQPPSSEQIANFGEELPPQQSASLSQPLPMPVQQTLPTGSQSLVWQSGSVKQGPPRRLLPDAPLETQLPLVQVAPAQQGVPSRQLLPTAAQKGWQMPA